MADDVPEVVRLARQIAADGLTDAAPHVGQLAAALHHAANELSHLGVRNG